MFVTIFKKITALIMSLLVFYSAPVLDGVTDEFVPRDADSIKLNFAAIADTHVTDGGLRNYMLTLGLADIQDAAFPVDALVLAGDITDHGYVEQWENVYDAFSQYDINNVILAEGNHDTWTEDDVYDSARELFIEYNKKISDRDLENPYYSTKVNGYSFIVLASEKDITRAYFSDEQLEWFDAEMAKAALDGLPIFVVSHWPINQTHGLPETWGNDDPQPMDGGIGEQSDAVEAILKKYENVFFITGHLHNGFGEDVTELVNSYHSIESDGSFHSVNLPCYMYFNARGQMISGHGFQFEVYENNVIIRGRSYSAGIWYPEYEYDIPLV